MLENIPINNDPGFEIPGDDPLDIARHRFRKGRFEFMGGPVIYTQCHGYDGMMNNERKRSMFSPASNWTNDPISVELGVDVQEQ